MEDLIPLLIFGLLSAIGSWIQNRREKQEEVSWEEVEGEVSEAPSPERAAPTARTLEEEIRKAMGFPSAEATKEADPRPAAPARPARRPISPAAETKPNNARRPEEPAPTRQGMLQALEGAEAKRKEAYRKRERAVAQSGDSEPGRRMAGSDQAVAGSSIPGLGKALRQRSAARVALAASVALSKPRALDPYRGPGD